MQVVCAWCEMFIGVKGPILDKSVSHGICEDCYEDFLNENKLIKQTEGRRYGNDRAGRDKFNAGN
jgi:hypothetical protein